MTIPYTSSSFAIVEIVVSSLTLSTSITPSANFEFTLKVIIKNQFGVLWVKPATVDVTSTVALYGVLSNSTETGVCEFYFTCRNPGTVKITAKTSAVPGVVSLNILKNLLKFTSELPSIFYIGKNMDLAVSVNDNSGKTIEILNGPYEVNLTLKNETGEIFSDIRNSSLGIATFPYPAIINPGVYWFYISAPDCVSLYSKEFTVMWGPVETMTVTPQGYSMPAKYLYSIDISLYNSSQKLIPYSTNVKLYYENSLVSIKKSNNGQAKFKIFFNQTGTNPISVTAESLTKSFEVDVQPSNNTDPGCILAINATTCSICSEANYEITNGLCKCNKYSIYNYTSKICECPDGLSPANGYCINCGNYFETSEVFAYYAKEYRSLMVVFSRNVNLTGLDSCEDILVTEQYINTLQPKCVWQDLRTLKVEINAYPDLEETVIGVNSLRVQAFGDICDFDIYKLNVELTEMWWPPVPDSRINAPDEFSNSCEGNELKVIAGDVNIFYEYYWTAEVAPENLAVTSLFKSTSGHSVVIPSSLLTESTVKVTLLTVFKTMNTSSSSTKYIKILTSGLQVSFKSNNMVSIKSNSAYTLQVKIPSSCYSKDFAYSWTSSVLSETFNEILKQSLKPSALYIPAYTLQSGEYTFTVTVSNSKTSGTALIYLTVFPSDLLLSLSRSSGSISTDKDFTVSAKSSDPDDNYANIFFTWTCTENYSDCIDSTGKNLNLQANQGLLAISNSSLAVGSTYRITVTASSALKSRSAYIDIFVNKTVQGEVKINFPLDKIDNQAGVLIAPIFTESESAKFKWTIGQLPNQMIFKTPYISLVDEMLGKASSYSFSLLTSYSNYEIESTGEIFTNTGPICAKLLIQTEASKYKIQAENCYDGDNEDYPLLYQFGVILHDKNIFLLSSITTENEFLGYFPSKVSQAFSRVCDSIGTCNDFFQSILLRRRAEEILEIEGKLSESENIPNLVIVLAGLEVSQDVYVMMCQKTSEYFGGEIVDKMNYDLFIDCFKALLSVEKFVTSELLESNLELFVRVSEKYCASISSENLEKVLIALEPYLEMLRDPSQILQYLGKNSLVGSFPGLIRRFVNDNLYFAAYRLLGEDFSDFRFSLKDIDVQFTSPLNTSEIYDFSFASKSNQTSTLIVLNLTKVGLIQDYTLEITESNTNMQDLPHSFTIKIPNKNHYNSVNCQSLLTSCVILETTDKEITLEISSIATYHIAEYVFSCPPLKKILSFLLTLVLLTLIFSFAVVLKDKNWDIPNPNHRIFTKVYSISSCITPQSPGKRLVSIIQVFTTLVLLLALIKAAEKESPTEYNGEDLVRGLISFGFTEIFTICSYLPMAFFSPGKRTIISYLSIYFSSLIYLIYSSTVTCKEDSVAWIVNFMIFSTIDLWILQRLYAWTAIKLWNFRHHGRMLKTGVSNVIRIDNNTEEAAFTRRDEKKITDLDKVWKS